LIIHPDEILSQQVNANNVISNRIAAATVMTAGVQLPIAF
jgi:hypothetical protein